MTGWTDEAREAALRARAAKAGNPGERNMLKIAADTLKMPDAMAGVMGGPSKDQARALAESAHPGKSGGVPVHSAMGARDASGHYVVPGGQGFNADHANSPLHQAATAAGYAYSHSTPIHGRDGSMTPHHTYAFGEHKVGVSGNNWETKTSSASGRSTRGTGAASLAKHLAGKASRYGLRK